jgi:hypothetical protein
MAGVMRRWPCQVPTTRSTQVIASLWLALSGAGKSITTCPSTADAVSTTACTSPARKAVMAAGVPR